MPGVSVTVRWRETPGDALDHPEGIHIVVVRAQYDFERDGDRCGHQRDEEGRHERLDLEGGVAEPGGHDDHPGVQDEDEQEPDGEHVGQAKGGDERRQERVEQRDEGRRDECAERAFHLDAGHDKRRDVESHSARQPLHQQADGPQPGPLRPPLRPHVVQTPVPCRHAALLSALLALGDQTVASALSIGQPQRRRAPARRGRGASAPRPRVAPHSETVSVMSGRRFRDPAGSLSGCRGSLARAHRWPRPCPCPEDRSPPGPRTPQRPIRGRAPRRRRPRSGDRDPRRSARLGVLGQLYAGRVRQAVRPRRTCRSSGRRTGPAAPSAPGGEDRGDAAPALSQHEARARKDVRIVGRRP